MTQAGKPAGMWISELEPVVLTPLLHDLNEVLDLGVICVLKHLDYLDEALLRFLSCDNHLEDPNRGPALALPELWVRVESL
jgi:hypothetical protein